MLSCAEVRGAPERDPHKASAISSRSVVLDSDVKTKRTTNRSYEEDPIVGVDSSPKGDGWGGRVR